jgi:hypothetical protein
MWAPGVCAERSGRTPLRKPTMEIGFMAVMGSHVSCCGLHV